MLVREHYARNRFAHYYHHDTRWQDNDIYGHVNNVTYYSYMDTAVNRYLIEFAGLDIHRSTEIAYVVNSACTYFSPLGYPDALELGLSITRLGNRSVTYCVGIFKAGAQLPSAVGEFVHVFVERKTGTSVAIPEPVRTVLHKLEKDDEA